MQPLPEVGDLVRDTATGRVGFYVGSVPGCVSGSPGSVSGSVLGSASGSVPGRCLIRPVHGGAEWEAEPADVQPATPLRELRARAAEINARSRRGLS
ncbi:hypothetical protein PV371_03065 [Streptomyces sp. TX20-6-3]|uniref:hypothetical protein n=1 Tax=Streptomyces sp. TX20-6-3 TaxID=3028705 RepID=UPI0029A487C9|nr:hypothetical protein [Streptomyces sp. TX20-6-3]MDX2558635.1 hypothetical protein [Streptomyces sp. TX20-6-3]